MIVVKCFYLNAAYNMNIHTIETDRLILKNFWGKGDIFFKMGNVKFDMEEHYGLDYGLCKEF